MLTDLTIDIYPDGLALEDVPATFDIDAETYSAETYSAEPYSWGQSRGMETAVSVELLNAQIGGLKLSRDMLVQMLSEAEVSAIEESVAEAYVVEEAA